MHIPSAAPAATVVQKIRNRGERLTSINGEGLGIEALVQAFRKPGEKYKPSQFLDNLK